MNLRRFFVALVSPLAVSAQDSSFVRSLVETPLGDAVEEGTTRGWRESAWFGAFQAEHLPWIYHEDHGWLMLGGDSSVEVLYFYDPVMGWVYTNRETYPKVYSFTRSSWLLFHEESSETARRYYDYSPESWLDYPTEVESIPFTVNGFRFSHATIPTQEIFRGGPPRDGIPAILEPRFVSMETADADYMEDEDLVLSITVNETTRAYPYRILNWHEIVNDKIDDVAFAATYCPLCGTGIAFNRTINGVERSFGVSGLLYLDNVLMYDHQSESLWSQLLLKSVTGPMFRTRLEWVEGLQITWKAWKERYPEGEVLSTDTGFSRNYHVNPYQGYEDIPDILRPVGEIRDDLEIKDWVYGIIVNDKGYALPRDQMPDGVPVCFEFEGRHFEATYTESTNAIVVTDSETGQSVPGIWSFWFSWQAFYRDTGLWKP